MTQQQRHPDAMETSTKRYPDATENPNPRLNSQVNPRLDQSLNPESEILRFQTLSSVTQTTGPFGPVLVTHFLYI